MKIIHASLAIILCLFMSASLAARLPGHYPDEFDNVGTISKLDIENHAIEINGIRYLLSSNLVVHSLQTNFSSSRYLRTGMRIGYGFLSLEGNSRQIIEIWILPSYYQLPEGG